MTRLPSASVVICAYTEDRWTDLGAAVDSARAQQPAPLEILLVIDHNPALAARARAELADELVTVLDNDNRRGLSGARNTALPLARGEIVAFLDDDATATAGWLAALLTPYTDPEVIAVGGAATPSWPDRRITARETPAPPPQPDVSAVGTPDRHATVRDTGTPPPRLDVSGASMPGRLATAHDTGTSPTRLGANAASMPDRRATARDTGTPPQPGVGTASVLGRPVTLPADPGDQQPRRGELDWVVGCTYTGQPRERAEVRNLMGCNMSFRRAVFARVGGFREDVGRVGRVPLGCEETELCIRIRQADPSARILFEPAALVRHRVSDDRRRWAYLARRSYAEGVSKAAVSTMVGAADALSTERAYTARVLPAAFVRELRRLRVLSAFAIVLSVGCAGFGYLRGRLARRPVVAAPDQRPGRSSRTSGGSGTTAEPVVSVVIPSAGRPASAIRCATSVLATGYPKLDVLLVDNRPQTPDSVVLREFAATDDRVRYVPEPVVGASNARNRGAAEATGEIIAFTDDDAVVDERWLAATVAEFADPGVDCVTGLVLPLRLDTPAQRCFEEWGGFGKGPDRRRFTASGVTGPVAEDWAGRLALYPFAAGVFGSGNSMAWRADTYRALGGCDPLLGPGTPTGSGEDLELFVRLIRGGGTLVYTPDAVVRHEHRREMSDLARQLHSYGTGLFPLFAVYVGRRPTELFAVLRRLPGGLRHMLASGSDRNTGRSDEFPAELAAAERAGMLAGPARLARALVTVPRRRLGLPDPWPVEPTRIDPSADRSRPVGRAAASDPTTEPIGQEFAR